MIKVLNIIPETIVTKEIFDKGVNYTSFSFPSISFDPADASNFNIDVFISTKVIPNLPLDCDIIVMPVSLTNNFLEFVGLRLAYHLRFTDTVYRLKPIIFLSDLGLRQLLQLTELAPILYTKGTYFSKVDVLEIAMTLKRATLLPLTENEYAEFVQRTRLLPPSNYLSNHSVSNEWSISKWSDILDVNDDTINELKEEIKLLLYFKFLEKKFPPVPTQSISYLCNGRGKVLLIDDEWEKGWKKIIQKFYSHSRGISFVVLEQVFKDQNSADIENLSVEFIKRENPDMIILDLRLTDQDFGGISIKETTGYRILKRIKEINPGFQVIIFSATNRLWNLLELQEIKNDGFIFKESPENIIEHDYASKTLQKLKNHTESCLTKSAYRVIWNQMKETKLQVVRNDPDFISSSNTSIDIAWNLLYSGSLNYCFLTLFQIIESYAEGRYLGNNSVLRNGTSISIYSNSICKLKFVYDLRNGHYYKIEEVEDEPNTKTLFKMSVMCAFIFQKDDVFLKRLGKLNHTRNEIAHNGSELDEVSKINELIEIIKLIRATNY